MPQICIVVALCLLCSALALATPSVRIVPERPRPGDVIFVMLTPDAPLDRASCAWRGRTYPFLKCGDDYQLVLPVAASTRAGGYRVAVRWKNADGTAGSVAIPVQVQPRRFGIQKLRLSTKQEQKYSAPDTAREYKLIGAALDRVSPERLWQGDFLMPVAGRITTEFGLQRYVNGHFDYRHRGLDIAAKQGTPVKAAADGVVTLADESFQLHGKTVIIDHGQGTSSLYLHMSAIEVSPGETVAQGQVIGRVGATGLATGPHLHYGVYAYHEAVDPQFWLHIPREADASAPR
jgi:murein DD-endopeptidase MepM/ murein hydrolase activator NlpD